MAQKEVIEFIAKVDDSNQVVPSNATPTNPANPNPQPIGVDPGQGLQEAVSSSLGNLEDTASESLEEAIRSSIAREAQLRVLREINQSIKDLQAAADSGGGNLPPEEPPSLTDFFDDPDNRFDNIEDTTKDTDAYRQVVDDLIKSFDEIDRDNAGPDPDEFDRTTEEFDKQFESPFNKDDIDELTESFDLQLATLNKSTLSLGKFAAGVGVGVAAITGLVVATQLYSSVLASVVENFGELSESVKQAQAESEIRRVEQQLEFADRLGEVLAEVETTRAGLRDTLREFLAVLLEKAGPFLNLISAFLENLMTQLSFLLTLLEPALTILGVIANLLTSIFKSITFWTGWWIGNNNKDENINTDGFWEDVTNPKNFLNVQNIRPKNVNGRDVFDQDDLFDKNL